MRRCGVALGWSGPQRGVVLAITLLILIVVTVIGVSSMSSSSLQMLLARNNLYQQVSFQNAESAVLIAEKSFDAVLSSCLAVPSECSTDISPPTVPFGDWSGATQSPFGRHKVEYLGWRPVPGEGTKRVRLYRFTSEGLGPNSKATTQLQTLWRKCTKSDGAACPG